MQAATKPELADCAGDRILPSPSCRGRDGGGRAGSRGGAGGPKSGEGAQAAGVPAVLHSKERWACGRQAASQTPQPYPSTPSAGDEAAHMLVEKDAAHPRTLPLPGQLARQPDTPSLLPRS